MGLRLELHEELCNLLGSRNVYFQPPESLKMQYDAIRYKLSNKDIEYADNRVYHKTNEYSGVVITRNPDTTLPDDILEHFQMCRFGSPYTADNLYHYPFTLYY